MASNWSTIVIICMLMGGVAAEVLATRKTFLDANKDKDFTFINYCFHYDGHGGMVALDGDGLVNGYRCTGKVKMYYENDTVLSMDLCRRTFPFHIVGFNNVDGETHCHFESYVICESGWVQIDNTCFQLFRTKVTAEQAIDNCKKTGRLATENPQLAIIAKSVYSRFWEATMDIWDAWMVVPTFEQYGLKRKDGEELNVAVLVMGALNKYTGVGYERFAQPSYSRLAEYMCQYTPTRTLGYMKHMMKIYAPIYPNFFGASSGMFMSSSRYGLIQTQDGHGHWSAKHYHQACERVAKVIGGTGASTTFPTKSIYDGKLLQGKQLGTAVVRDSSCRGYDFHGVSSTNDKVSIPHNVFGQQGSSYMCNANSVMHTPDGVVATPIGYLSNIACSFVKQRIEYRDCDLGWKAHQRKSGVKWCHYVTTDVTNADEAERRCVALGAHLDGFEDEEEQAFFHSIASDHTWLGAQKIGGKYYWLNGVSNNHGLLHVNVNDYGGDRVCWSDNIHWHPESTSCRVSCGKPANKDIVVVA